MSRDWENVVVTEVQYQGSVPIHFTVGNVGCAEKYRSLYQEIHFEGAHYCALRIIAGFPKVLL